MTGAVRALRHPSAGAARLGVLARQAGQLAADGAVPRTSLNVPVSGHHRLLLVRADLERARAVAYAHGGTVNDVVLAAVAGGARSVLAARGELTPPLVLRASVRAAPDPRATGNPVGILLVPLPVAEADPARRLAQIAAATAARKRQPPNCCGASSTWCSRRAPARRALVVEGDAAMAAGHPSPVREHAPVVPGCG